MLKTIGGGKVMNKFFENKKRLLIILAVINVLVIAVMAGRYIYKSNHLVNYHITKEDFQSYNASMNDDNERFFEGVIGGDEYEIGTFYTASPYIMWEKGYWKYTLTYTATGETEAFAWPFNPFVDVEGISEAGVVYFEKGTHTVTKIVKNNADLLLALKVFYQETEGEIIFEDYVIQETSTLQLRQMWLAFLLLSIFDALFYTVLLRKEEISKGSVYVFAANAMLTICATYPLFLGYVIGGHDIDFHLCRIEGIKDALLSGQFPVRLNPDFEIGYGYADTIFYGNIFLYIPALLRLLAISLGETYLIYVGLVTLATVIISQICFEKMFNNKAIAYMVTFLYVLAPYRIVDVYLRAAVGEYTAMAFLPLVAYGIYRIYTMDTKEKGYTSNFIILALALTGVMQSHVLTGEMLCIFMFATCFLLIKKTFKLRIFLEMLKSAVMTILLNVWFLVPFLDFRSENIKIYVLTPSKRIGSTGAYLFQLIQMFPQYALGNFVKSVGSIDEMYLCLGIAFVFGLITCGAMLWVCRKDKERINKWGLLVLLFALLSTWMTTIYFPWDTIYDKLGFLHSFVSSIQFVWRFLSFASLFSAIATGIALALLLKKEGKNIAYGLGVVLMLITFITSIYYMQVLCLNHPEFKKIEDLSTIQTCQAISGGEYSIVLPDEEGYVYEFDPYQKEMPLTATSEDVEITNYGRSGTNHWMTVTTTDNAGTVTLPLFCYKGYKVKSSDGVITTDNLVKKNTELWYLEIPANYSGDISISYEGFWYWRVAEVVSLISFILMIAYGIYNHKRKSK